MKVVLAFILGVLTIDIVHAALHPRPRPRPQPYRFSVGKPMQIKESK